VGSHFWSFANVYISYSYVVTWEQYQSYVEQSEQLASISYVVAVVGASACSFEKYQIKVDKDVLCGGGKLSVVNNNIIIIYCCCLCFLPVLL